MIILIIQIGEKNCWVNLSGITWNTTKQQEQKLITVQRAMERRMINITIRDKIRNSQIRKQTQIKDIRVKIKGDGNEMEMGKTSNA